MKIVAFFTHDGRVGKSWLAYHLAWMFAGLDVRVVVADLDPQANATSMFVSEERLEELWCDGNHPESIHGAIAPLLEQNRDIREPHAEDIADNIRLLAGDLLLDGFEDRFNAEWARCLDRDAQAFRVTTAFDQIIRKSAEVNEAALALIDVGANPSAISRAAVICAEYVVIPVAPDLYSLQSLRILGPTLRRWRQEWDERRTRNTDSALVLPTGQMGILGYVVMEHQVRFDRSLRTHDIWMKRIPGSYQRSFLLQGGDGVKVRQDPNCLAILKHYAGVKPMALEAQKPMFHLKPADGAIGAHVHAVRDSYHEYKKLAIEIARRCAVPIAPWAADGHTSASN